MGVSPAATEPAPPREYQIKAVFLYNFAQFVDWPPAAFPDGAAPLVIGVLGKDPFGSYLDDTVRGEKVGSRALVVRRFSRVEDVAMCHILFISRSEADRLGKIVEHLAGRHILTVSDIEGSAYRGVMIRFLNEKNHTRLRINLAAARRAGLTISSKLLRPAEIVSDGRD